MTAFAKLQNDFTTNIMGYSALGIILSTCLGSVAVMTTLMHGHGFFQMAIVMLCVGLCSGHNAAILSVQKPALIFKLLVASTLVSLVVITLGILL